MRKKLNLARKDTIFYDDYHDATMRKIILMQYVAWGDQAKAEAMLESIENDEEKLFNLLHTKVSNKVNEPSGKVLKDLTPFQAALCVGDFEMCEMFKGYFSKIDGALKEMQDQFCDVFQGEMDAHVKKQKGQALAFKNMIEELITIIITASDDEVSAMLEQKQANSKLGQAFKIFRKKVEEISMSEQVFNPYYLLSTFKIHEECLDEFTSWERRNLFCIQVIGFMQRYLPAWYLQAFAQGFHDLVNIKETSLSRSFELKHSWGARALSIVPIAPCPFGLGFDYWVSFNGSVVCGLPIVLLQASVRMRESIQKFCQAKTRGLSGLMLLSPDHSAKCIP